MTNVLFSCLIVTTLCLRAMASVSQVDHHNLGSQPSPTQYVRSYLETQIHNQISPLEAGTHTHRYIVSGYKILGVKSMYRKYTVPVEFYVLKDEYYDSKSHIWRVASKIKRVLRFNYQLRRLHGRLVFTYLPAPDFRLKK